MTFSTSKKRIIIWVSICFMILFSVLIMGLKTTKEIRTLTFRNAADSLMPYAELATEAGGSYGGRYTEAQKSHAEMIQKYVDHMNSRHIPFLLRLPPFSKNNIVKCLEKVAEDLKEKVPSENTEDEDEKACKKIRRAAESIDQFFNESNILTGDPVVTFEAEAMSKDMQNAIRNSLMKAHEKAEIYAENPSVPASENACMTNRRAIVLLYLARFGYQEITNEEDLKKFRTDINRTIYHNRRLQQDNTIKAQHDDAIKADKAVDRSDYSMLEKHSESERRRLRLLQAIIDNDIQEAQVLLQIAIKKAMSDNKISAVIP